MFKLLFNGWESFYSLFLLPSYSHILEYENFINRYLIYSFWNFSFRWVTIRYCGTGTFKWITPAPYIVGLEEYLANTISIISSSLELLFEWFSENTFITKSADVVSIWQRNSAVRSPVNSHQYTFSNSTVPNTEPIIINLIFDDLSCGSGKSLVDTTLSISKMLLLCFIILDLTGDHVTTHSIYHTEIFFLLLNYIKILIKLII